MMKHIGIMGGTFNPVHIAHLILAEAASEKYAFDETWFMPSKHPPHKPETGIVADEHRLAMLELAISGNDKFYVSDIELIRDGLTYTADTLDELHKQFPDYRFSFIIGGDSVSQFINWYKPEQICKLCHIVAAGRGNYTKTEIIEHCNNIRNRFNANIDYLDIPSMEISSSQIRDMIKNNHSVRYYLPDSVIEYIIKHNLYKDSYFN